MCMVMIGGLSLGWIEVEGANEIDGASEGIDVGISETDGTSLGIDDDDGTPDTLGSEVVCLLGLSDEDMATVLVVVVVVVVY